MRPLGGEAAPGLLRSTSTAVTLSAEANPKHPHISQMADARVPRVRAWTVGPPAVKGFGDGPLPELRPPDRSTRWRTGAAFGMSDMFNGSTALVDS